MHILCCLLAFLVAVLPPVSPKRPKTARLSRGAVWTNFEALKLENSELLKARKRVEGLQRIAVVSAKPESRAGDEASVCAFLLGQKLHYGPHLLPVDFVTTRQLFRDCETLQQAVEVAREHDIQALIWCAQNDQAIGITHAIVSPAAEQAELASLDIHKNWLEDVAKVREQVHAVLKITNATELDQLPSDNSAALMKLLNAYQVTARIIEAKDEAEQKELCEEAIMLADEALKLHVGLIEAYILKASCLDELGRAGEVKQTLRDGYSRRDRRKTDELTNHELDADHARFCLVDDDSAFDGYLKIVELDPHSLRGNWGLIDLLLTPKSGNRPLKEDIDGASELAIEILAKHPDSAVSSVLAKQVQ